MSDEKPGEKKKSNRAAGGVARAKKLTPEARSSIGKKGASERWRGDVPKAICGSEDRPLRIGGVNLACYVLEDGTRVLSQAGFLEALGRHRKASVRKEEGDEGIPAILQGKNIKPLLTEEILEKARPIRFQLPSGLRASGYRADLLSDVCEIYLQAREKKLLAKNQEHIAQAAEILIRGFAQVGIIALVDEATGYQDFRAKKALGSILEAFIAKELQRWVSTFPADYYREMFRLRGLNFPNDSLKRPQYFGVLTNDLVYRRLAPGVLAKLKEITPRNEKGRPKQKYFQRLSDNVGYPKLREHLGSLVAIMKLSPDWHSFMRNMDRLHPRFGDTLSLQFDDYKAESDDGAGLLPILQARVNLQAMQLEVKINLPANVDDLISTLAQVAANQERIEQAQATNRELLAGLAQRLDDAASRPTATVVSPPAVQAGG